MPTTGPAPAPTPTTQPLRRSTRSCRAPSKVGDYIGLMNLLKTRVHKGVLNVAFLNNLDWSHDPSALGYNIDPTTELVKIFSPLALALKANSADNPNWYQAMNGPLADGYWDAMEKELNTLKDKNSWKIVDRKPWMNVLPSTWAFKCKRYPDGSVRKLKARFCVRGDKQKEGIDYF